MTDSPTPSSIDPRLHEVKSAIETKTTSFDLLVVLYYRATDSEARALTERETYRESYDAVYSIFEQQCGQIVTGYFCKKFIGAAVLTSRPSVWAKASLSSRWTKSQHEEMFLTFNILDVGPLNDDGLRVSRLLYQCRALKLKLTNRLICSRDRSLLSERLMWTVCEAYAWLDKSCDTGGIAHVRSKESEEPPPRPALTFTGTPPPLIAASEGPRDVPKGSDPDNESVVAQWEAQLREEELVYLSALRRSGTNTYSLGMVLGLAVAGLLFWVAILFMSLHHVASNTEAECLLAVIGGSTGAMTSVMTRMKDGDIGVDFENGQFTVFLLGSFRPILGVIFSLLAYAVIVGGVFHTSDLGSSLSSACFIGCVGFASGFSERFAQGLVSSVVKKVSTTT